MYRPDAVHNLICCMLQEEIFEFDTYEDYFKMLVREAASGNRKKVVLEWIDGLFARNLSDKELEDIWNYSVPTVRFANDGTRIILRMIRAECARQIAAEAGA